MLTELIKAMTPYLAANLLTVALIYGYASHHRLEREGRAESIDGALRIAVTLVVLFLLSVGMISWLE